MPRRGVETDAHPCGVESCPHDAAGEWKAERMRADLIVLLVLGAVGLFLALPRGRSRLWLGGSVLLAAAGGALVAIAIHLAAGAELGWFIGCSLVVLFAALRVITHTKPVYSALYFVLLVVAVTGLLLLMQAEFLAVALIIVYAGAILVTYVFVIMLAQQQQTAPYDARAREPFLGCLAGFALLATVALRLFPTGLDELPADGPADASGTVIAVGTLLWTDYIVGIQLAGLLLLAAMVGAIAIARRKVAAPAENEEIE